MKIYAINNLHKNNNYPQCKKMNTTIYSTNRLDSDIFCPSFTGEVNPTHIKNFGEVVAGKLYRGSIPFEIGKDGTLISSHVKELKDKGIKAVIDFTEGCVQQEKSECEKYGITYIPHGMPETMGFRELMNSAKNVADFLQEKIEEYGCVFFHCQYGQKRTGLGSGAYEYYKLNLPASEILAHAKQHESEDIVDLFLTFAKSLSAN